MNRISVCFALTALLLSSCETLTQTATTSDVKTSSQNATVADLEVSERITYTMTPSKAVQRGGLNNVKKAVEAEALVKKGNNADVLLEPQFVIEKKRSLFGSKITSITVSGRPAVYTNFRSLSDSVWSNPAFRGMKGYYDYTKASKSKSKHSYVATSGIRSTGFGGHLNVSYGYSNNDGKYESWYDDVNITLGYQLTPHLFVGAGGGVMYFDAGYEDYMFPIYGNARYYFSAKKSSWFADVKVGKSILRDDDLWDCEMTSGLFGSISLGYSFGCFDIALKYTRQNYTLQGDGYYNDYYDYYNDGEKEDFGIDNIGLSIGVHF